MREKLLQFLPLLILILVLPVLIICSINDNTTIKTVNETVNETTEVDGYNPMADQALCPVQLYEKYGWDCTNHLNEWYPGKLTADGSQQEIPLVEGTSHEKFKQLCQRYGLDASYIRTLENKYNLREGILLAILIAETSGGHNGNYVNEGCYNLGNVGNNDRHDRVCFEGKEESIEQVAITLNNRMLGKTITLGCLSDAGSCQWRDDGGYRYATSDGNRERNVKAVMNMIYAEDLGEDVDPARFVVKRVSFQ